ncbi:MAG TPA: YfiR family protein, partial [Thermoanaerobaculia bacterium]|nr:YfiR family protein [Thermoanaerobaculia bacterium]
PPAAGQPVGEYEVKAAFLFNFTKFVEWPAEAFAGRDAPFRICVVGRDPFDGALGAIVAGERAAGRRLVAEHHARPEAAGGCQIVFFAGGDEADLLDRLPAAGARHRLVVGESAALLRAGGHFRFRLAGERVRLSVNLRALEAGRLRVSSRLLRLAEVEIPGRS